MANWLNQLQSLLGQQGASSTGESSKGSALLPGAIGGLAGLLVASKSSRKLLAKYGTSALLAGGGAVAGTVLWNKYQQKMRAQNAPVPGANTPAAVPADVDPRSVRLITALVFAARSDGHIDDHERANIEAQLRAANIDVQARVLIDQALAQPLDPQRLAEGIVDPQEALEIYYVSCAVIDIDHFMERSYLDALAAALKISEARKGQLEEEARQAKAQLAAHAG